MPRAPPESSEVEGSYSLDVACSDVPVIDVYLLGSQADEDVVFTLPPGTKRSSIVYTIKPSPANMGPSPSSMGHIGRDRGHVGGGGADPGARRAALRVVKGMVRCVNGGALGAEAEGHARGGLLGVERVRHSSRVSRRALLSACVAVCVAAAACGTGAAPVAIIVEPTAPPPAVASEPPAAASAEIPPAPPPPLLPDDNAVDDARRTVVSIMARKAHSPNDDGAWARATGLLVDVLELAGRAEKVRLGAAQALLAAQEGRGLPDMLVARILAVVRAHTLSCPVKEPELTQGCAFRGLASYSGGLDVTLARLAIRMNVERVALMGEIRGLVAQHPGTTFQSVMVEELRDGFETSSARVAILAGMVDGGVPQAQRGALDGLAALRPPELPRETCAALARGLAARSDEIALRAAIHVARWPCSAAERARALDGIEAWVRRGPLPPGPLYLLCALDLPDADRVRPWAVLRSIAKSPVQPLATRRDAMGSVHACGGAGWPALFAELRRDSDAAIRSAAAEVDRIRFIDFRK
jgi:hypothetical protein